MRAHLRNERMRFLVKLKQEAKDSKRILILVGIFLFSFPSDQLMHNVELNVMLCPIDSMLRGGMHVHVVSLIVPGPTTLEVCDLQPTHFSSLELEGPGQVIDQAMRGLEIMVLEIDLELLIILCESGPWDINRGLSGPEHITYYPVFASTRVIVRLMPVVLWAQQHLQNQLLVRGCLLDDMRILL